MLSLPVERGCAVAASGGVRGLSRIRDIHRRPQDSSPHVRQARRRVISLFTQIERRIIFYTIRKVRGGDEAE